MTGIRAGLFVALILLAPGRLGAQVYDWDPRRGKSTRAELEELLARLTQAAESPAYSEALRARSRVEASVIRARLEEGDFQVGDRILLRVEGEQQLSDTFIVAPGRLLPLPVVGDVPLMGVLRSELQDHTQEYLARFFQNPMVRARALIRLSILGDVPRPGFYTLPSELLLDDALMLAGGLGPDARVTDIRVERGNRRIWEGEAMEQARIEGRTLDQMNLQAGDRIVVPRGRRAGEFETIMRTLAIIISIPAAIYGMINLF